MPGRPFTSPADFNTQFQDPMNKERTPAWSAVSTSSRGPARRGPGRDAAVATDPNSFGLAQQHPLGRNYYVPLDTNYQSLDPSVIGRRSTSLPTWSG